MESTSGLLPYLLVLAITQVILGFVRLHYGVSEDPSVTPHGSGSHSIQGFFWICYAVGLTQCRPDASPANSSSGQSVLRLIQHHFLAGSCEEKIAPGYICFKRHRFSP